MLIKSQSNIVNENKKVFAWYPVPIKRLSTNAELGIKSIVIDYVWLEYVYKRHVLRSGIYGGVEYQKVEDVQVEDLKVGE